MAHRPRADFRRRRWNRRGIQHRERRPPILFSKKFVLESRSRIAAPRHSRIPLDRIIPETQLKIFRHAKLQQSIDILVAIGDFEPILDLEHSGLHGFRSCR